MIKLIEIDFDNYLSEEGYQMCRESGKTPEGHEFHNMFVLRDPDGAFLGHNQYRSLLAEHFNFELVYNKL